MRKARERGSKAWVCCRKTIDDNNDDGERALRDQGVYAAPDRASAAFWRALREIHQPERQSPSG